MMTATHTHTNTTLASIQKAPSYSHYFQVQLARNVKCAHKHDRKTTQTSDDNSDPSQIQHWLLVFEDLKTKQTFWTGNPNLYKIPNYVQMIIYLEIALAITLLFCSCLPDKDN